MAKTWLLVVGMVVALVSVGGVAVAHASVRYISGMDATVAHGETLDKSLYASGRNIDIAGTVNGDVYCAGQTVDISGTVNGDVLCLAQTIHISGTVNGSVRAAAQSLSVSGTVTHTATVAGQTVGIESGGKVGSDITVAAQDFTLDGTAGRDLLAAGQNTTIEGTVGRDVQSATASLSLGSASVVGGSITYTSEQALSRADGAKVSGRIIHNQPPRHERPAGLALLFAGFLFKLYLAAAFLLLSLVLVLIFPRLFERATDVTLERPLLTLVTGFVASIVVPILIFLLLASVIAIPLAILILFAWLVVEILAIPVAGYFLGRLLLTGRTQNVVLYMLLGVVILLILFLIPLLGFFVLLLSLWFGAGTILLQVRRLPKPDYLVAQTSAKK